MKLKKYILILYIIIPLKFIFSSEECSDNCETCENSKKCTKCETSYKLIGTHERSIDNEITCTNNDLSNGYIIGENGVYYPCNNTEYNYLEDDTTKCYSEFHFISKNYYTIDNKKYYPCNRTIHNFGVPNCEECSKSSSSFSCEKCKTNYVIVDNNGSECVDINTLDNSYYKVDKWHYEKCFEHCKYCSSRFKCIECESGFYMFNDEKDKCVNESGKNMKEYYLENYTYYNCRLNGGIANCKECDGKNNCTKCDFGYVLINGNHTKCIKNKTINFNLYYTDDGGINYYSCIDFKPDKNCTECKINPDNPSNIICNKCQKGYFFVDDDRSQCYKEESLIDYYYKVDKTKYNNCSRSIPDCIKCKNESHCFSCVEGKGILDENFQECQDINNSIDSNIIFKDENDLYYSCNITIKGCSKCTKRMNCIESISNYYCLLDGVPIELNKINDSYYIEDYDNGNYTCKSCSSIEKCLLCSSEDNCYQCIEGFTIINDDRKNCDNIAGYSNDERYFTFDNGRNFYGCGRTDLTEKAIQNCTKCVYNSKVEKNNCLQCEEGYIILDDDGSLCIPKSGFIADLIDEKRIIKDPMTGNHYTCNYLMENCYTCETGENCTTCTNCTTCKSGFIFLDDDKKKCLDKSNYTEGHYFTIDNINYYSCIDNCFECDNRETCINCDEGYELNDFGNKCELILYDYNDIKKNCIYLTKNINNETISADNSNFNTLINKLFEEYYSAYNSSRNYIVKYINKEDGYTVLIFKNEQCSLYLFEDDMFRVNSSGIITELKKYAESKDIIQLILIYKNYTSIAFFENKSGARINIEELCPSCLQIKYNITYNYKNRLVSDVGEKLAKIIQENEIDIFNENSEFFQTLCTPLQIEGIDIPLNVRNSLIYKGNLSYNLGDTTKGDIYACSAQCSLIYNNPLEYTSECECDLNYDIENFKSYVNDIEEAKANNKSEKNETDIKNNYGFLNNSKDSFDMFTCSKYGFTSENIKKNAGFYTVLVSSVGQGVCLILLVFKLKINSFAKLLILANPPPKKKAENNKNDEENNNKRIVKRVTDIDYYLTSKETKTNNIYNNNYINNTSIPSTQKRINTENENQKNLENSEDLQNSNLNNGEIHHQKLNIFNNNYVTPGKIKLGLKNKNRKNDNDSEESNNDDDIFSGEKNSEMDYYPVMKFIEYDINAYRDIGYTYEQKDIKQLRKRYEGVKLIQYNLLNKNEKTKILPLIYKSLLKDHLPHKYGIYYDKRKIYAFYCYLFCLKNPIINLLINSNSNSQNFIPFSVKIIKIIFTGITILFINSLFINQQYIYNKYIFFDEHFHFKNLFLSDTINSSEKLKYAINHSIKNAIIAYVIILLIDIFLTWLFSIRRRVKNLLDEHYEIDSGKANISRYNKERRNFEKELLEVSDLKNIYIWITGFFYVFMIIFFIYLVNFCSIYKGVVDDLFIAGLWTFIIFFFMPVISCIIITSLRYIGLKLKAKFAYDLSRILMEI